MATYHAEFLSRDGDGRFQRRLEKVSGAESHEDALAWVNHGYENGKWALEGPVTVRGPIGTESCEEITFPG